MSDLENGYCPLNGHGLYGGSDRPCPWCRIAEYELYLDNLMNVWRAAEVRVSELEASALSGYEDGWHTLRAERDDLKSKVERLEKCRQELIEVTNACRDPRVNLTHTLEQCVIDAYAEKQAAEARIEELEARIRELEIPARIAADMKVQAEAAEAKLEALRDVALEAANYLGAAPPLRPSEKRMAVKLLKALEQTK